MYKINHAVSVGINTLFHFEAIIFKIQIDINFQVNNNMMVTD